MNQTVCAPYLLVAPGTSQDEFDEEETMRRVIGHRTLALGALIVVALVSAACGGTSQGAKATVSPAVLADLAPTGTLRVAIQSSPPFMAQMDATTGSWTGVGVGLAAALAKALGVPYQVVETSDPPKIAAEGSAGKWDVAFIPFFPPAAQQVAFAPAYMLVPHGLTVRSDSGIQNLAEADQTGIRIASEAGSGHTQMLIAYLKHAQVVQVTSEDQGLSMLQTGQVQAYASGRFELLRLAGTMNWLRVLDGDFFVAHFAAAIPNGHAAGLAYLERFIASEKASGAIAALIASTGLVSLSVAP
jgi:polar amino acid transport system substrate-binding protein